LFCRDHALHAAPAAAYGSIELESGAVIDNSATPGPAPALITYAKLPGTDSGPGGALRWKHCVSYCTCDHHPTSPCPIAALDALCRSTPHCTGFNSHGWLKSCVAKGCCQTREPSPGCDLYVGSNTTPGGWPPPPPHPKPPVGPALPPWNPHAWPHSPPPAPPAPPTTPPAPVPLVDDWHFPAEEAGEEAAAEQPRIVAVDAASNSSGTVRLSVGGAPVESRSVGDATRSGWQLRSMIVGAGLGPPIAVAVWPRGELPLAWRLQRTRADVAIR